MGGTCCLQVLLHLYFFESFDDVVDRDPRVSESDVAIGLIGLWAAEMTPGAERDARVLERGTMSEAQFEQILAKQMPIEEKRARSDYEIETDTLENAKAQVLTVIADIKEKLADA